MHYFKASEALKQIESSSELADLWDKTRQSLTNCIIQPCSLKEYAALTGIQWDRLDYVGSVIDPTETGNPVEYVITLIIGPNALLTDIAHEIAHLYLHGRLGFPIPWLAPEKWKSPEMLSLFELASHMHVILIHPIIDRLLKDINIFNPVIYSRIATDYRQELLKYSKNPLSLGKDYFVVRTIATRQRLPRSYWQETIAGYEGRNSFIRLQERIKALPLIPAELNPNSVYEYVAAMWQVFGIAKNREISLCYNSPLIKTNHAFD